ncbi:MAG: hypothetical protein J6S42_02590, partial [Thermoguttaceae bacterium]|nr:hypothetical protein [Thermoguttaceae bacterium]
MRTNVIEMLSRSFQMTAPADSPIGDEDQQWADAVAASDDDEEDWDDDDDDKDDDDDWDEDEDDE